MTAPSAAPTLRNPSACARSPRWSKTWPVCRRAARPRCVVLADGDAVVLPFRRLRDLLRLLRSEFPLLERVSSYATAASLLRRDVSELAQLRAEGLTLLFVGLESGDDATLTDCAKGVTVAE